VVVVVVLVAAAAAAAAAAACMYVCMNVEVVCMYVFLELLSGI
jgi:hypothetical protein